jgi:hypothetical protein
MKELNLPKLDKESVASLSRIAHLDNEKPIRIEGMGIEERLQYFGFNSSLMARKIVASRQYNPSIVETSRSLPRRSKRNVKSV